MSPTGLCTYVSSTVASTQTFTFTFTSFFKDLLTTMSNDLTTKFDNSNRSTVGS